MGLAHDLLQQADHLASYEGSNPSQASLRRAVSTAYYALFHLLIEDAAWRWQGSAEARTGLERAFAHGPMKTTSIQFGGRNWRDWHGNPQPVPGILQKVAKAFVKLQEDRHTADYDSHEYWTSAEVGAVLNRDRTAFPRLALHPQRPDGGQLPAHHAAQQARLIRGSAATTRAAIFRGPDSQPAACGGCPGGLPGGFIVALTGAWPEWEWREADSWPARRSDPGSHQKMPGISDQVVRR